MKPYKIFWHPDGSAEAVKQGWSWPAFGFGVFWAFYKHLWIIGSAILLAEITVIVVLSALLPAAGAEHTSKLVAISKIVAMAVNTVCGMYGNQWRTANLLSKGFAKVWATLANTPAEALAHAAKAVDLPY